MNVKRDAYDVEVRARDGLALRARVVDSPEKNSPGTLVMAHAMFARKSEFFSGGEDGRATFAQFFVDRGWGICAFDFRGHGESVIAEGYREASYDDLVFRDLPAVVAGARERTRGRVVVVGHSLGGHVACASAGLSLLDADAVVAIGANVWLRRFEPSLARWIAKQGVAKSMLAIVTKAGKFPARSLRIGSDDASATMLRGIFRTLSDDAWASDDGATDYVSALAQMSLPLFALVSDGDALMCHPECGARFSRVTRGPRVVHRIARADDGRAAPSHMQMVTTNAASSAWHEIDLFCRGLVKAPKTATGPKKSRAAPRAHSLTRNRDSGKR